MNYAIVLYMDDEKTALVSGMVKRLAPECGSYFCLGMVPHITVCAFSSDDESAVIEAAGRLAGKLSKGKISIASIGVFNPSVLFLAPVVDSYLLKSSQTANDAMREVSAILNERYVPGSWVPHMTVAMKMSEEGLCKGFENLLETFKPFRAVIDKAALIRSDETDPFQELAVYHLS